EMGVDGSVADQGWFTLDVCADSVVGDGPSENAAGIENIGPCHVDPEWRVDRVPNQIDRTGIKWDRAVENTAPPAQDRLFVVRKRVGKAQTRREVAGIRIPDRIGVGVRSGAEWLRAVEQPAIPLLRHGEVVESRSHIDYQAGIELEVVLDKESQREHPQV